MEMLEHIIASLDSILDTKRKRHITGGILLSASTLFSGLAITVMTIKNDDVIDITKIDSEEETDYYELG